MRPLSHALAIGLLTAAAAGAAPPFEDKRAGVAFSPPDGWIEVPTPPLPDDEDAPGADEPALIVTYEQPEAGSDGLVTKMDAWLLRARGADAAAKELEARMKAQWRGFEVTEWRDLGSGKQFEGKVEGGFARGAVLANGARHAGIVLVGGRDLTDAEVIHVSGTWTFIDVDAQAPLRIPPGWKATTTLHYRIRYQGSDAFADEVGRHLEAISAEFRRTLPLLPPDSERGDLEVRVFAKEREFEAYASANGVRGAEAYFSPAQNELVAHIDERAPDRTFHVLYHEALHQYMRDVLGRKVRIPSWMDEGLGEYFYAGSFASGGFTIGVNYGRLAEAKDMNEGPGLLKLAPMMEMTQAEFYRVEGAYGQGWSVVYFMLTDARYRGSVMRYLEELKASGDQKKAIRAALGDLTVEQLEKDWKGWLLEEAR